MLGRALTPEQVMETAFDACAAIVDYDAAAIALYDKDRAKHRPSGLGRSRMGLRGEDGGSAGVSIGPRLQDRDDRLGM